ncbi:g2410 [Coccomyxa elongata]
MLWALLCSVALRDLKGWLVKFWQQRLVQERTLILLGIGLLLLPLRVVTDTGADIVDILRKWKQYALEFEADFRRQKAEISCAARQAAKDSDEPPASPIADSTTKTGQDPSEKIRPRRRSTSGSANPELRRALSKRGRSRRKPASQTSSSAQALGVLSAIAKLGFKALKSTERRGSQRRQQLPAMRQRDSAHQRAQALFRWLLRACLLYELSCWFVRSWMAALQLMLVCGTLLIALGLVPFLYFVAHWYLMQSSPLEAWDSPPRSLIRRLSARGERRKPLSSVDERNADSTGQQPDSKPRGRQLGDELVVGKQGGIGNQQPDNLQKPSEGEPQAEVPRVSESTSTSISPDRRLRRRSSMSGKLEQTCSSSKTVLVSSWDWFTRSYFTVDAALRRALHDSMHTLVTVGLIVGLLVGTVAVGTFVGLQIAQEGRTAVLAVSEALPTWSLKPSNETTALATQGQGQWQTWLREWQGTLMSAAERNVPSIYSWLEAQVHDAVQANNLTQVMQDLKVLSATLRPPKPCTAGERRALLVAEAKAKLHARRTHDNVQHLSEEVRKLRVDLGTALQAYEQPRSFSTKSALLANTSAGAPQSTDEWETDLEEAVAAADANQQTARAALADAVREDEAARQELDTAERLLSRCTGADNSGGAQVQSGAARQLMQRLQAAYSHVWQLQLREGLAELVAVGRDALGLAREMMSGKGQASGELNALQRIAAAASEPLLALGRSAGTVIFSSLGSTTAVALTSSLGILRLGFGVVQAGVQFTLFCALFYYLLAAEADPLLYAVRLLPLSDGARQQAATALSDALRGVFLCALKLALFHAGFTWLTLRMFRVHFVYATTVAAALTALLPLIPSWLVAVPAALQLVLQDRLLAAVMLLAAHFGAWFLADEIILAEIPGSHPYLTGLGIIGGMYTFDNPLQGAIVGPMLLSLLSVFYNLHSQFMGSSMPLPTSKRASISRSSSFDSGFSRFRVPPSVG